MFHNVMKLWGHIEQDLTPGTYTMIISNLFDVQKFEGKKYFYISEMSSLGGKNSYLGTLFIVCCCVMILLLIIALVGTVIRRTVLK